MVLLPKSAKRRRTGTLPLRRRLQTPRLLGRATSRAPTPTDQPSLKRSKTSEDDEDESQEDRTENAATQMQVDTLPTVCPN